VFFTGTGAGAAALKGAATDVAAGKGVAGAFGSSTGAGTASCEVTVAEAMA